MHKKVELLANVAIVIITLLMGAVFVKQYLFAGPGKAAVKEIAAGTKLSLSGIDWQKNGQTMLLVVAPGCHYCSESAPFYQRLVRQTQERGEIKLMAVFPQGNSDGSRYLKELGLPIEAVTSASLDSMGIIGTPTLLLVNNQGVVTNVWIGQLPPDKEAEVLSRL